ncbi:hypothetical protein COCON_G00101570 [Conger conger]|uniref:C2H2-type domain-containing protein n=1 Tax=Conger conger TaxID=82655 RepID=A0A9Q1DIH1_CONCO|nr:hypothetical protein COCON_G00101570 [Conger conger]
MCRSQRENEALKTKLLLMEIELTAVRGYGEGTPGTSGAAAANGEGEGPLCKEEELHMQPCPAGDPEKELQAELKQEPEEQPLTPTLPLLESADWGMELQGVWSVANGLRVDQEQIGSSEHGDTRLDDDFSPPHYTDSQRPRSEKDEGSASHLEQKQNGCPLEETSIGRPADDISAEMPFPLGSPGECDGSARVSEDRLEEDPKSSQSQAEQKISTSGAAAANGGEGPLCKEEELHMQPCPAGDPKKELQAELKQEPEEQPLTPALPLLESAELGLQIQSVWSEANSLEISQERNRPCRRSWEHGDRNRSVKDEGSTSHLEQKQNGCPQEKKCFYGPPDEVSAKSPCRTEGQEEEFICTCCGKTFPDALELKTHEEQHSAGKRFSCSECGKGFTSCSVLEKHEQWHLELV